MRAMLTRLRDVYHWLRRELWWRGWRVRYRIWQVYQGFRGIYYRWWWRRFFKRTAKAIARFGCSVEEATAAFEAFSQACQREAEKNDEEATGPA